MTDDSPKTNDVLCRAMQWKFTSCAYNIENRDGFSTFSLSEGLSDEDREDLVKYAGGYSPPEGLPSQPVTEEELDLFPIAFASFRLRSGKRAITRTRYVGKDYAGARFGNLFSHGLIIDGDWPFHPIQLWEPSRNSLIWSNGLSLEEQNLGRTPGLLNTVDIRREHLYHFDIPEFLDYLDRYNWFKTFFFALRQYRVGKTIVLKDEPENAAYWIAALQYLVPFRVSQDISFSSYVRTYAAAGQFHVAATSVLGSAIDFHSPNLTVQFFPFDFTAGASFPGEDAVNMEFSRLISLDDLRKDEFPSKTIREVYRWAEECGIPMSIFDDSVENIALSYDFFKPPTTPLSNAQFDALLKFFSGLDNTVKRAMLEKSDFFNQREKVDPRRLKAMLPHFIAALFGAANSPASHQPSEETRNAFIAFFIRLFPVDQWKSLLEWLDKFPKSSQYAILAKLLTLANPQKYLEILLPLLPRLDAFIDLNPDSIRLELEKKFQLFVVNLFRIPVSEPRTGRDLSNFADRLSNANDEWQELFQAVDHLVNRNDPRRKFGEDILSQLEKWKSPDSLFFQTFLVFALYVGENREIQRERFESLAVTIRELTPEQRKYYFDSVYCSVIERATTPNVHRMIIEVLFNHFDDLDMIAAANYTHLLHTAYEASEWVCGHPAKCQAEAMIRYVMDGGKSVFEQWTTPPPGLLKALTGLFDQQLPRDRTGKFNVEDDREKAISYRANLLERLTPLLKDKNRGRLEKMLNQLGLPKQTFGEKLWNSVKRNGIKWVTATIVVMVVLVALILLASLRRQTDALPESGEPASTDHSTGSAVAGAVADGIKTILEKRR